MRKRISVCMLAAMMSVTSMYSFAAQGAENETEQETGIEQESETQAEEAVDPMSADQILMRARKFEVSEILNAYFGEGKWDENLITSQESLASERNEYDGENRKLWIVQTGVGFLSITITYKDEVPDEKVRLQEGEDLLQTLNINIMDEYMKQTDFVNDDRSVYTYYLLVERAFQSDSKYQMKMQYRLCMMLCGMGCRFQRCKRIRLQIRYRLRFNIFQ